MYRPTDCITSAILPTQANIRTRKRREQRKRAKERMYGQGYENMMAANKAMKIMYEINTLATGSTACQSVPQSMPVTIKENPMYVDYVSSDKHSESAKTNYLLSRMSDVKSKKREVLYKQFGLGVDDTPASAQELIDRITAGKFVLPTEKEEELYRTAYGYYSPSAVLNVIKWRDPSVKEDKVGYKDATDQLEVAAQAVQDLIMIDTNANALEAIKSLENWTPTSKAN